MILLVAVIFISCGQPFTSAATTSNNLLRHHYHQRRRGGRWTNVESNKLASSLFDKQLCNDRRKKTKFNSISCLTTLRGGGGSNEEIVNKHQQQQTTSSSSNQQQQQQQQQSPYEYIPITALNDYGQSTQLRNAMECSKRFGTPVLACICCRDDEDENENDEHEHDTSCCDQSSKIMHSNKVEDAILVCSLQRVRPGVISSSSYNGGSSSSSLSNIDTQSLSSSQSNQ